jgi:hypothetical protein
MSKIIVSVCGWCEADPEKVRFQLITDMDDQAYITGVEWLELPESGDKNNVGRDDYILECAGTAFATALDGEYDHVDVEVEKEEPKKYKAGDMVYWDDPEGLHSGYYPITETIGDDRLVLRSGKEVSIGEVW